MKINCLGLSNPIYNNQPCFKNKWEEHKSWGAVINPKTQTGSFKTFVFPDTRYVFANIYLPDGSIKSYRLNNSGEGIFELKDAVPKEEMKPDYEYNFTLHRADGSVVSVKDPYSFKQEGVYDKSVIYDHNSFIWHDKNWYKFDKARISRLADNENGLTSLKNAKICEIHIGTLSKEGDFKSAKEYVSKLKELGFNAVEIMPLESTYSFNWGYDGADKFAVSKHLGGNNGLKDFVDWCHKNSMNVIMDMVPNHLGVDMASLHNTGPYTSGNTPWGAGFNYEGDNSKYVRDFIVNAALNWVDNYHCDGIRFDMTKFMNSDATMQQIAAELHYHKPDVFLIAEDARSNVSTWEDSYWFDGNEIHDKRIINPLFSKEFEENMDEQSHLETIEKIRNNQMSLAKLGFDSEWDFNYFHTLNEALYGNINLDYLEKTSYCAQDKVKYVMSHDEIGNNDGTRLLCKMLVPELNLANNLKLTDEDLKRVEKRAALTEQSFESQARIVFNQKIQLVAQDILMLYQTGKLDKYKNNKKELVNEVLAPLGIKENTYIDYDKIEQAYKTSFAKNKLAQAFTFTIPGAKMVFQGDEKSDLTPFRFFRKFHSIDDGDNLYIEKGYDTGFDAFQMSKLGNINYSNKADNYNKSFGDLMKNLISINDNSKALQDGFLQYDGTRKHYSDNVIALNSKDEKANSEIFTVSNFSPICHSGENKIKINFPKGKWVEILNTDSKKYQGEGNINNKTVETDGNEDIEINLAGYSVSIFKKIAQ